MNANITAEISIKDGIENNRRLALMGMLAVALGLLALVLLASNTSAAHYDWTGGTHTVVATETYTNATIDATNIDIPAGKGLILINVTLNFTTNGWLHNSGTLEVKDYDGNNATAGDRSIVQRLAGQTRYYFRSYANANLLFKNSEMKDCGQSGMGGNRPNEGFYIASTNATIIGSTIHGGGDLGVVVDTNGKASIINSTIYSNNQMGVLVYYGKVNITGCTFYGQAGWAIFVQGNTAQANIKTIDATGGSGVGVTSSGKADIADSYIHNFNTIGTYWDTSSSGHVNNTNVSYNNWNGNSLNYLDHATVDFKDCKIYNSRQYGIISYSSTITVTNTKSDRNSFSGIWANGGKLTVEKGEFSDNPSYGIEIGQMATATIANSTIERNGIHGLWTTSVTTLILEGNKINKQPNGWGIVIDNGHTRVDILNNTLTGNHNGGINARFVPKLNIKGNKISQTNGYGIWVTNSAGTMNGNTIKNSTNWAVYHNGQDNFRMDKNTFDNNQNDIYVPYSWVDITNSTFNGTAGQSVYFYYSYSSTIVNNKFTYPKNWNEIVYAHYSHVTLFDKNTFDGKYWQGGSGSRGINIYQIPDDYKPVITNNTFKNIGGGIYFADSTNWNNYGLSVTGNNFVDLAGYCAIELHPYYYNGKMEISKNTFNNVPSTGIYLEYPYHNSQGGGISIQNNSFEKTSQAVSVNNNYGYWYNYPPMAFKNNTINNSQSWNVVYFWMVAKMDLADNTITNCQGGFEIEYARGDINIDHMTMTNNQFGIRIYDQWWWGIRLYVRDSTFSNNNGEGIYTYAIYYTYVKNSDFSNNNNGLYFDYVYWGVDLLDSTFNNNSGYGVRAYDAEDNFLVENCEFNGNNEGLYLYYNYYGLTIKNSTFNDNSFTGLYMEDVYSYYGASNIENCEFQNNNYGLRTYYSHFELSNAIFANNSVGAYLYGGNGGKVKIQDSKFYDNSEAGIYTQTWSISPGSGSWNNVFLNNNVGIRLSSDNTNFEVNHNSFSMGTYGIQDWGYGIAKISNNDFELVGTGIYIEDDSADIDGNTFSTIWSTAIYIEWGGSCTISNNKFSSSNTAVYLYSTIASFEGNEYIGNNLGLDLDQSMAFLTRDSFSDGSIGIRVSSMSILTIEDITMENFAVNGIECPGMAYMDILVKGTSLIKESPIQMYGDITVANGGTLTVEKSRIVFDSPGGTPYRMVVQSGGTLDLMDAELVAANGTRHFGFTALAGSTITVTDTTFKGIGYGSTPEGSGMFIGGQATLEGITIDDAVNGLFISNGVYMTMRNSTIANATANDIWIQDASTIRVGNTRFDRDHVTVLDTSKIIIDRIIRVTAIDDSNYPYSGIDVTVTSDGTPIAQAQTDEDGQWFSFFEGAIISKEGYTETLKNYTVVLTDGIQTMNDSFVLTSDYDEVFAFGTAPVRQNGPTPVTMKEDTSLDVDLTKYFLDNDTMTYSVKGAVSLRATFNGNTMTLQGAKDWFGTEAITLVAKDTHGLSTSFVLTVVVTPVNDLPVIAGVPNMNLYQDNEYVLDLTPYITDPDTPLSSLTITVSTQYGTVKGTTVVFNYPIVTIEYVRISVKDAQGGSAQDILVSVQAGNNPPKIKALPEYFNATEDVEEEFDLAPYLDNGGANISLVTISSTAKEIIKVNGTKITVLFPNGPEWRTATIIVSNQNGNRTYQVKFYVMPVNDAPVLADLPMVTVTEDVDYVFDLTPYISDVDMPMNILTISTNRTDVRVDGKLLIINIKDAGSLVTVAITVSDGHVSVTKTLRITVINVNDQPVLGGPKVSRSSGTTNDKYTFTVTLTDPDTDYPTVYVVIDGQRYSMKKTGGTYATGAEFSLTMNLKAGKHSYHFEADDGTGAPNSKAWTSDQTNLNVSAPMNWMPILLLIIILVVVAIILVAMRSRSAPKEEVEAGETETEETGEAFQGVDEEEEEKEAEEEPEAVEEEPEEEAETKTLKAKDAEADQEAAEDVAASVKPRRARDPNLPKSEDLNKVEPEKPKDATTLSEKDSEAEAKGSDQDLDTLMKDIMKDSKVKKKKIE